MKYYNSIVQEDMYEMLECKGIPIADLRNKKILITGANGMLATYLVFFFMYLNMHESSGIEVFALTRNRKKAEERFSEFLNRSDFHLIIGDVCQPLKLDTEKLDYIIHAAGNASPRYILEDPVGIIQANTIGTMNVLKLAKDTECGRVLYTSTREVYGKAAEETEEISENMYGVLDPTELRACYPESKRLAETILESYRHQFGVDYVTVRIAHSYGPGMVIQNDGRVMSDFISDIVNQRNIVLKSSGTAERAFCYLTDAVSGILTALIKGESGEAYNLANEKEPKQIKDVAVLLTELFPEKGCKVVFEIPETMSAGYSKMGRTKLDVSKLENLGWKCSVTLEEGLKRTVHSFEDA